MLNQEMLPTMALGLQKNLGNTYKQTSIQNIDQ